jgi:hypothetical protein
MRAFQVQRIICHLIRRKLTKLFWGYSMNVKTCFNSSCWNNASHGDYCEEHFYTPQEKDKTFAEQAYEISETMETRIKSLEADVKRLKRELGLK